MNKEKTLRAISAVVKLLGLLVGLGTVPFIEPKYGVMIILVASTAKDSLRSLGDILDDGQQNGSFVALLLCAGLCLGSGCAQYIAPDGTRLTLFCQKAAFEGLRVSPKTGLSVKSGQTEGDTEMAHAIASGAAEGAARGAKKAAIPFLP